MQHAVQFSTGDFGRAFTGLILSRAGFQLTMVGSNQHRVEALRQNKGFTVEVAGSSITNVHVECETLLETDPEVVERLATCDVVTTSVGFERLDDVAAIIAAGIQRRMQRRSTELLNVIVCERLVRASTLLRQLVLDRLTVPEVAYLRGHVGFADSAWDRIIPTEMEHHYLHTNGASPPTPLLKKNNIDGTQTQSGRRQSLKSEVHVVTEEYFEWVVDDTQLKGDLQIAGMLRRSPLQPFIFRAMFLLTAGHVTAAFFGHLKGYKYIIECMADPEVEKQVRDVMQEIAQIEEKRHGADRAEMDAYIEQAVARFKNPNIHDTVLRVAWDPIRKLAKEERLIKPLLTAVKYGVPNTALCRSVAAALHYVTDGDRESLRLHHLVKQLGVEGVLKAVSRVSKDSPTNAQLNEEDVTCRIVEAYGKLAAGEIISPITPLVTPPLDKNALAGTPIVTALSKVPKAAVHFGAGKIGRGFVGQLLALAGYEVTFADVDKRIVHLLHKLKRYDVLVLGLTSNVVKVQNVDAILSMDDQLLERLVTCELVTTAVGVNILPKVAVTIARGLKLRRERGVEDPLNVIACENAVKATTALKAFVLEKLEPEDLEYVSKYVGFADSAVDRIVPSMEWVDQFVADSDEQEVGVLVEEFFEWDVDHTQMKGDGNLLDIDGITLTDNLQAYVERKLFTLNTGHAVTAYLGYLKGYKLIADSINDPDIERVVRGAMEESAAVLIRKYSFDPKKHAAYIERIIGRFKNTYLQDDVTRVGRDPLRKLGPTDRLLKPFLGTVEYGLPNDNLCIGIAAALLFDFEGDPQAGRLQELIREAGPARALGSLLPQASQKIDADAMERVMNAYGSKVFGSTSEKE